MEPFRRMRRSLCILCTALLLGFTAMPVFSAMVSTDDVLSEARGNAERAELMALLDRDDVRAQLEKLGVEPEAAQARVAAMTDAEIAELNARMEDMPAGGSVASAILIIFLVFVITDVIGATDIFPFIHPVN